MTAEQVFTDSNDHESLLPRAGQQSH
jgi:hypothetical protein